MRAIPTKLFDNGKNSLDEAFQKLRAALKAYSIARTDEHDADLRVARRSIELVVERYQEFVKAVSKCL